MLIKYNQPRILGFKDVLIIPGINDLSAEFVAEMQDDSIIAGKFDSGELEIVEIPGVKGKKGEELSAVDRMLKATDKNAVVLVGSTIDVALLEDWLAREKRVPVKKALRAQLAKIRDVKFRDKVDKKTESKAG